MDNMDAIASPNQDASELALPPPPLSSSFSSMAKSTGQGASDTEDVPESVLSEISEEEDRALQLQLLQSQQKIVEHHQPVSKSEEYRQLFHLPPEEVLVRDFNCAVQKNILLQGHMYLFVRYVCFYSNIFGFEKKKIIPLRDITSVMKAKTAGIFSNAIEIVAWGKMHFFGSFLSRDEAYRLIVEGWTKHSEHAKLFFSSQDTLLSPRSLNQMPCGSFEGTQASQLMALPDMNFDGRHIEELPQEIEEESNNKTANEDSVCNLVDEQSSEGLVTAKSEQFTVHSTGSVHACTSTWQLEDEDAPKVPEHFKMVGESKFPIDVEEFFRLFFSNDATNFTENFHRKCGDEGFQCSPWNADRHFGHVRDVSFRHPIKFYFGSRFTHCQEVQRFRVYRNSHLVIETSQQMNDIPYADYFRVEGLWDVERVSDSKSNQCRLRVFVNVAFSKKTFWKGKIEQGTSEECKEAYATWISDAHALLGQMDNINVRTMDGVPLFTATPKNQLPPQGSELTARGNGLSAIAEQEAQCDHAIAKAYNKAQDATERHQLAGNREGEPLQESNLIINKTESTWETSLAKSHDCRSSPLLSNVYSSLSLHWKPGGQFALTLALFFAVIIIITQIGIIIMLARHPASPSASQTISQDTWQTLQESKNVEVAAWLQRRVYYLEEEISMMEVQFKSIQHELTLLRKHFQGLDLLNSKNKPD